MSRNDPVEVEGSLVRETADAYLVDVGDEEPVWFPKSVCEWDAGARTLTVPEWLAIDRGVV